MQKVKFMVGMLSGRLYVVGFEENIIRAKNPSEKDSAWYRITLSDGCQTFTCTCGSRWNCEVEKGKVVEFVATTLHLMSQYDMTFAPDMTSGYCKLKLRTFKPVVSREK